ncbi:methylmalonyl-CoA carboxyltransferase [Anoxybacter fermentans]|uniref:Methylmalonyl-CoA carboxyltransferase n=1 Tax=Anoxybacter fermentans TaxID=1323375 RepID=A0A3Q9HQ03_9FIRM|nr:carboxyl transferase domain-containing protein [Anoxybacter fermentans]AZR72811.1 methylmalonyl-CoA carboxyltransferase [Anoxybacter fermentans]
MVNKEEQFNTEEKIKELKELKEKIRLGGGEKAIEKQHKKGKYTARERIEKLLDPGSFQELSMFVSHRCTDLGMADREVPGEGVVVGYGTIDNRLVYVFAQDFTVMGGSLGEAHAQKIVKVMDLALKNGAPLIGLNDSGGARIQEGVDALNGYGNIFFRNTISSGVIPQISVILGPCAGGAVYSPAITDFIFMVDQISKMFITGPDVIKKVTGEEISPEALGGAAIHNKISGNAHFMAQSEDECFEMIRALLSYIPSNNQEDPPYYTPTDPPDRETPELIDIVPANPKKCYDMRNVINIILDKDSFMEVHSHFAENIIVGFGRLNGRTVGVIANNPNNIGGCLDIDASDKAARFIRFCDCFNIPLITLVDTPGYMPGTNQEYGGIIRHGAKLLYAYSEATVPKITLIVRKAYGGAYLGMCSQSLGADIVYAWPIAEIAVMGPEGATNIIYRKEIANAENPEEVRQAKIKEYRDHFANPYVAAKRGMIDDVINIAETRIALINALEMCQNKREYRPPKKHGNIPL